MLLCKCTRISKHLHASVGSNYLNSPTQRRAALHFEFRRPVRSEKERQVFVHKLKASSFQKKHSGALQFEMTVAILAHNTAVDYARALSEPSQEYPRTCGSKAPRLTTSAAGAMVDWPPKTFSMSPGLSIAHQPSPPSGLKSS